MDSETADFYQRVRDAYLEIAKKESNRFRVIDADRSIEVIQEEIVKIVLDFLNKDTKV